MPHVDIEFVPHIGTTKIGGELVKEELDQFEIYLGKKRLGFIGKKPGSPICFTERFPAAVQDAVKEAVLRLHGESSDSHQPPNPDAVRRANEANEEDEDE